MSKLSRIRDLLVELDREAVDRTVALTKHRRECGCNWTALCDNESALKYQKHLDKRRKLMHKILELAGD